jgi:SAM-dependent methyltransferase/uncharacterized protein YbaR (Trm112 family)
MAAGLRALLRCPLCGEALAMSDGVARCREHEFPVRDGVPRLLPPDLMLLLDGVSLEGARARTYRSFGFEWKSFSQQLDAYEANFRWYLEPASDIPLAGLRVLDAGCGMGRHTHHFLKAGAEVVAIDASPAVEVAAANNQSERALFVQADLLKLPLERKAFDLVCCLGVLHHIDDTLGGLRSLVAAARPGGRVLVFLYHDASQASPLRRGLLALVSLARRVTTRLPFWLLRALSYVLAGAVWLGWVGPLRLLSGRRDRRNAFRSLPLAQYVDYPFRVLWNDQFDRFSAPIEKRFSHGQVEALMKEAGLVEVTVLGGYGWRAIGTRPVT